jgi:hypothetical protein
VVLIRTDAALDIAKEPKGARENQVEGEVAEARFVAGRLRVTVQTREGTLLSFDWHQAVEPSTHVWVRLDRSKLRVLRSE